jgi:hypothetical protein
MNNANKDINTREKKVVEGLTSNKRARSKNLVFSLEDVQIEREIIDA